MVYGDSSNFAIAVAWWLAAGVIGLVLLLIVYVFILRLRMIRRARRHQAFMQRWRPLFARALANPALWMPPPARADRFSFLLLWNELLQVHADDEKAKGRVRELLRTTEMDTIATRMLLHGNLRKKLMAAITLGHLGAEGAWESLERYASSRHSFLALVSAQALMLIDPARAIRMFVHWVGSRDDWPAANVAAIFQDAGPRVVSQPIATAIQRVRGREAERLIPYLETCDPDTALLIVRECLASPSDDRVIAPCLHIIGRFRSIADRDLVLKYLHHPRWHIRARAARALGQLAVTGDEEKLLDLLSDPQWWVRYRAAQALAHLPTVTTSELIRLRGEQTDRYGRDVLDQVIAERG